MSKLKRSHSFPESYHDRLYRLFDEEKINFNDTINKFKEKDHNRMELFAELGSPSSEEPSVNYDWRERCCDNTGKIIDYFLEREEETQRLDEEIRLKSYAGFYYFIKWFIRALFLLFFTTLGTICGKEIGCAIKDNKECETGFVKLMDSSPHIISSIFGSVFGLIVGQWIGRFIWDKFAFFVRHVLRKIEKYADRTKFFLFLLSIFIYISITSCFSIIFWLFINFKQDDNNIIGALTGAFIGLLIAILSYIKGSNCNSGQQETPWIGPVQSIQNDEAISVIVI